MLRPFKCSGRPMDHINQIRWGWQARVVYGRFEEPSVGDKYYTINPVTSIIYTYAVSTNEVPCFEPISWLQVLLQTGWSERRVQTYINTIKEECHVTSI